MYKRRRGDAQNGHEPQLSEILSNGSKFIHRPSQSRISSSSKLFFALLLWLATLSYIAIHRHHALPTPKPLDLKKPTQFSEIAARETIHELAHNIGLRVVGTKQEKMARDYILNKLEEYRPIAEENGITYEVEIQIASGSHRFDLMSEAVLKTYTNITNIILRLSSASSTDQAILLNSHYDTTIVSPGAADDGIGVAVMLEQIRIISHSSRSLKNAIIFLFNGAEETLQDASHAFITQHSWAPAITGVINLEAMGNKGREILFQANSPVFLNAYYHVPHPHGSVLSNDIFQTGLIMSDTDFRQFVDHGNLVGLDMAFYTNSYLYHTMGDVEGAVQMGSIQNFGDNVAALLERLGYEEVLDGRKDDGVVFFDVLGLWFIHYTRLTSQIIYTTTILISLLTLRRTLNQTLKTLPYILLSHFSSIFFGSGLGFVLFSVFKTPMLWFSREYYPLLVFGPVCLSGMMLPYIYVRSTRMFRGAEIPVGSTTTNPLFERTVYDTYILFTTLLLCLTTTYNLGVSYVLCIYTAFLLLGELPSLSRSNGHLHPATYFIAATPFIFTTELSICTLDLFVPIMGRAGVDVPADVVVGGLVGLLIILGVGPLVGLMGRVGKGDLRRGLKTLGLISCVVLVGFWVFGGVFDGGHPKRVYVEYKEDHTTTPPTREILIAHSDPASIVSILNLVSSELSSQPVLRTAEETDGDWAAIYPFSHFIQSYSLDVSHLPPLPTTPPPTLTHTSTTNSAINTRTISLTCHYPHHIWTVLSFTAQVTDWSLDDKTLIDPTKRKTYMIRNAGGYGSDRWNVTISVIGGKEIGFEVLGVERDGFHQLSHSDDDGGEVVGERVGGVPIGKAWKWSDSWRSAEVLGRVEGILPGWVTGLFLGVGVRRVFV